MFKGLYAKLSKFNKRGGEKGFTLVELMIVIAVIAILALVLLPKAGVLKDKAKESGLKVNMSLMEAEVTSVIDNFTTDPADIADLETRINTDINNALETTNLTQKLKNPVTGVTGSVDSTNIANGAAAVYIEGSDNDAATVDASWPDAGGQNYRGVIGFAAYPSATTSGKVEVKLIPYDVNGNRVHEMEKTISQ